MTDNILPTPQENTNQDSPLDTLEELKARRKQGLDEIAQIQKIIEEIEQKIADLACPWKPDTVLTTRGGELWIVDKVHYRESYDSDWKVTATRVRKDLSFGATVKFIYGGDARKYKAVPGFTVTKEGLVPTHKARNL